MTLTTSIASAGILFLLIICLFPIAAAESTSQAGYIHVGIPPDAQFDTHMAFSSVPATVMFVDNSLGSIPLTYQWDFGDGATSTEPSPTHIYTTSGTFTVKLTVTNAYGTDTEIQNNLISLGMQPTAAFAANPTNGVVPLTVQFSDQSAGTIDARQWDFGDGIRSTEKDPVHVYTSAGTYNVILTVSNGYGSSDAIKPAFITVAGPIKAQFTAAPTSGKAPVKVNFADKSLGNPTSWKWDFGDGTTSEERNPVHTFTRGGTFEVKLTIGRESVTASSGQSLSFGEAPKAEFTVSQRTGNPPFVVQFTDISTGTPTKWNWQFGDGITSPDQNPQHIYQKEGTYDVKLTVTNKYGSSTAYRNSSAIETTVSTVVPAVQQTSVITQEPTIVKAITRSITPKATTAKSPVSPITTIAGIFIGLLAIAIAYRK